MTSTTDPSAADGSARAATASCTAGSNRAPRSSRRAKPSCSSTLMAWSCTAWTPSTIEAGSASAWLSARSRLSTTGSHSDATLALVSASVRLIWSAHFFRALSRSASARSRWSSSSAILRAAVSALLASAAPVPCKASWLSCGPGPAAEGSCRGRAGGGDESSPGSWCAPWSLMGSELGVDDVVVAVGLSCGLRLALRSLTGGSERLVDLLQLGGQAPDPID
jgi:hypothetical protein